MKRLLFFAIYMMPCFLFAQTNPEIVVKRNTRGQVTFKISLVNEGSISIDWGKGEKKTYKVNDEQRINDVTVVTGEVQKNATIKIYGNGIKVFSCSDQFLTAIDVSPAANLVTLDCGKNNLKAIDVSKNKILRNLTVNDARLKVLDVSQNTKLVYLHVGYNYLKTIDLSHNRNLSNLNLSDNLFTLIDLSQQKLVRTLTLSGNKLKNVDVNNFPQIRFLDITYNKLSACTLNSIYEQLPIKSLIEEEPVKKTTLLLANNRGLVSSRTNIAVQKGWMVDVEGKGTEKCL